MSEITKHALEDSLKTLLLRKPFNKITIGDLTPRRVSKLFISADSRNT